MYKYVSTMLISLNWFLEWRQFNQEEEDEDSCSRESKENVIFIRAFPTAAETSSRWQTADKYCLAPRKAFFRRWKWKGQANMRERVKEKSRIVLSEGKN